MSERTFDFVAVTELSGDSVTRQQVDSVCNRYYWAGAYCAGRTVLEVACGSGPGLGYLASKAEALFAGDITKELVDRVRQYYGSRISVDLLDAQKLPFADASLDVVILFEALYYLPRPEAFVSECRRVLRNGGVVLVATSNKDMSDFNPSPGSRVYHGVVELRQLFDAGGFSTEFFGYWTYDGASLWQRLLLPIKRMAVATNMVPKTMHGKKLLKRLVFGQLVTMPHEITSDTAPYLPPEPVQAGAPDRKHRIIYCAARRL
jgi:SAM-dependent methyltransferase